MSKLPKVPNSGFIVGTCRIFSGRVISDVDELPVESNPCSPFSIGITERHTLKLACFITVARLIRAVLCVTAYAKILPSIVKAISVPVVNFLQNKGASNFAMHSNLSIAGASASSIEALTATIPRRMPLPLHQPLVISGIDDGNLALREGDMTNRLVLRLNHLFKQGHRTYLRCAGLAALFFIVTSPAAAQSSFQPGSASNITQLAADPSPCNDASIWYNFTTNQYKICPGGVAQVIGTGSGSGTVTSVTGTANQIDVATGTTTPVLSIDSTFTFPGTVTNPLSIFGATTSAQFFGVISDETGTGVVVGSNTPTLVTPVLGAATGTSLALGGGTALTTTNQTGTGNLVLATSPTLATPNLGTPSTLTLTNATGLGTSGHTPNLYAADSGAVNAYVVTLSPAMSALTTGVIGCFKVSANNTSTTPTVNFNGLGAKTIVTLAGGPVGAGDLTTAEPACVIYDGTNFDLINKQSSTGTGKQVLAGGNPQFGGTFGAYNNISLVNNGICSEFATVDSSNSAAITATTLYSPTATGRFKITGSLIVTTPATTSSILGGTTGVVITYTDGTSSVAQSMSMGGVAQNGSFITISSGNTGNTTTTQTQLIPIYIFAKTGVAIQYAVGYTSVGGTAMVYQLHLVAESC